MKVNIAAVFFAVLASVLAKYKKLDAAIEAFAEQYASKLQGNPKAEAVFAIAKLPAAEAGSVYQKTMFKFLEHQGAPDATELSRQLGEAIAKSFFGRISSKQLMKVMGHNLAFSLQQKGDLQLDTASQLANEAARDFLSGVGDVSTPERKVQALLNVYEKFWTSFGLKVPEMARLVVPFSANALGMQMAQ